MDLNLVVLAGYLAAPGEFNSDSKRLRLLLTVRSARSAWPSWNASPTRNAAGVPQQRVDVIPVTLQDPSAEQVAATRKTGVRLWVVGSVQRLGCMTFLSSPEGRRSRVEIVAEDINVQPDGD